MGTQTSSGGGGCSNAVPMPAPHDRHAPYFDGDQVQDFLDLLEQHVDRARVVHLQLPGYVFRYCSRRVKRVIENMLELIVMIGWH